MTTVEVPIGAKVQVAAGIGYVRWTGANPKFSAGKWVGVELLDAKGKNDGAVQGERYFQCEADRGVFVRPSQVQILETSRVAASARPSSARPPLTPASSQQRSAITSRVTSPQRAPATAAPSTPPQRAVSRSSTQNASPSAPASHKTSVTTATPATARPAIVNVFKRPTSVTDSNPVPAPKRAPTPAAPSGASTLSAGPSRTTSPGRPSSATAVSAPKGLIPSRSMSRSSNFSDRPETPPAHSILWERSASPHKEPASTNTAQKRELDELRIKVRLLESRRTEDQDRLKGLEAKASEADSLRAARVKLQAKFQELQHSVVVAQRSARDMQTENGQLEIRAVEALDQLEMAALDREVAEEKAEATEAENVKLEERIAELEMEVALLKEENEEYERPLSGAEGERTSLAFIQLEKHNEKLKEALIRLRDISAEAERSNKARVTELEKNLAAHDELTNQLELSEDKLADAEARVEDLKIQLDDAMGAEDMLEQLTDRNLQLSERIEEMRVANDDLEALKELNDELEENHVEAERQLNQEINTLSSQLRDERNHADELDGIIYDMGSTINQFRDLVSNLQSEIDELRMQQAAQESESATTFKESHAVMSLNLKLQSSAAKAQSRTIDLEMQRLELDQLREQLKIAALSFPSRFAYLPDAYHEGESASVSLYLFFRRISSKIDTLVMTISQAHGLPQSLHSATSQALVGVCELRGKLRQFSSLNRRFGVILSRCTPDEWVAFGKLASEIVGVENKVDGWISLMKSEDFNEGECAQNLAGFIAQYENLAESALHRPDLDVGERQSGLAHSFDCDLDNFAAAVGFARQAVLSIAKEEDVELDLGDSTLEEGVYEPVQRILDQVRAIKVPSSKLIGQVEEVVLNGALSPDATHALEGLAVSVSDAVDLAVQLAQRIGQHVALIRSTKQPLRLDDINLFLDEVTAQSAAVSDAPPWDLIGMYVTKLGNELAAVLPRLKTMMRSEPTGTHEVPPPWLARVIAIKEAAAHNVNTEHKVARLSEEVKDMLREIKLRDQSLQESGVKVETLERRLEATRKQADMIIELENDVTKAKKQEKVYQQAIEQLQAEQDALEVESAKLRKGQAGGDRHGGSSAILAASEHIHMSTGGIESAHLAEQMENLRGAVRFLRRENNLLKSKELYNDIHLLPSIAYQPEPPVLELDPSSPTSPSSPASSTTSDGISPITPTKHSIETESKLLFREIAAFQSSPKIVDVSNLGVKGWQSRKKSPEQQVWQWKVAERDLERRVESLGERARQIGLGRK